MITENLDTKVIIFDLDGVILDSVGFLREYIKNKYEDSTEEDFKNIFRTNFWDGLKLFKQKAEKSYNIRDEYSQNKRASNTDISLYKGARDMVNSLSARYILVVNSSDQEGHIKERLIHNGVYDFFDCVLGKETSTSKIEKFDLILQRYNVLPHQVIFITDTIGDILESDNAGIPSIAVTWGVHSRDDFEATNFKKLTKIIDVMENLSSI